MSTSKVQFDEESDIILVILNTITGKWKGEQMVRFDDLSDIIVVIYDNIGKGGKWSQ